MKGTAIVDFETEPIDQSHYPPRPVGVAIKRPGRNGRYWAFGHPSGNNCTEDEARAQLADVYEKYDVGSHHGYFDWHIGEKAWGLWPKRERHCTIVLGYLADPFARTLELKEVCDARYGQAPVEQAELYQFIKRFMPEAKRLGDKKLGQFISRCPGDVVYPYAVGDTTRCERLLGDLLPEVQRRGMSAAYAREMRLVRTLVNMTNRGVPVDCARLERDYKKTLKDREKDEAKMRSLLGCAQSVDLNKDVQAIRAWEKSGLIKEWVLTAKGNPSLSADNIRQVCENVEAAGLWERLGVLDFIVSNEMEPWLRCAGPDGLLHIGWNATRRGDSKQNIGARTGRLSSNPGIQNVPKALDKDLLKRIGPYPMMRSYLVPGAGNVWLVRDYRQQEFRLTGHYEGGPLKAAYDADPFMDIHDWAMTMIVGVTGREWQRRSIKNIGFGILYGAGVGKSAEMAGVDFDIGKLLRTTYLSQIPGVVDLIKRLKQLDAENKPYVTWGGREYFCEPGREDKKTGRWMEFQYKMLNYLIQGSAGDVTKEAMNRADEAGVKLIMSVHDELSANPREREAKRQMRLLREAMESLEVSVPMISDPKWSPESWGAVRAYEEPIWRPQGARQ